MTELTDHAARNRAQWDAWATDYAEAGRASWSVADPTWGMWSIPEAELGALGDTSRFAGRDVIELGCGTAYFSAWFARMGARPRGIDNSPAQLETARALQAEFGIEFPVELGTAEALPYADASFDVAFSEYGASIWCDPRLWIPEASRVLRPGGELIFLANSVLSMLCVPDAEAAASDRLLRPQFGMHRFEWTDDDSVEFHLAHGEMIDLLAANGLQVQRLLELQAPAVSTSRHAYITQEWARQWPCEEIWVARKVG
jgi:SAM-dependent methyltransferase